jgi:hypothetical protein
MTLINDARLNAGKSPIGFWNPALYHMQQNCPQCFNTVRIPQSCVYSFFFCSSNVFVFSRFLPARISAQKVRTRKRRKNAKDETGFRRILLHVRILRVARCRCHQRCYRSRIHQRGQRHQIHAHLAMKKKICSLSCLKAKKRRHGKLLNSCVDSNDWKMIASRNHPRSCLNISLLRSEEGLFSCT